ncbi:MAG: hypothetical protein ACRBDI_06370 [Alphaproteobacteria bacterium]
MASNLAYACCWACPASDCDAATDVIDDWHEQIEDETKENFDGDLQAFEEWMIEVLLYKEVVPAMGAMASQMGALSMHYTQMIGAFLDAQIQLDTQRVLRKLTHEAHKDYRPSEGMCYFGTNVKSLAATDQKGDYNSLAMSRISINRFMGSVNTASSESAVDDYASRWDHFIHTYCDVRDNNMQTGGLPPIMNGAVTGDPATGLSLACDYDGPGGNNDRGAEYHKRINRDIDYTRLIEDNRTLEVDFTNDTLAYDKTGFGTLVSSGYFGGLIQEGDEEDVLSMAQNLYGNRAISREMSAAVLKSSSAQNVYFALRSVAAKRTVAQATFNAIIGLRSAGTTELSKTFGSGGNLSVHPTGQVVVQELHQTRRYMLAIMNELLPGQPTTTAGNIFDLIGYSPSYFSQLEILAKRIYQNPDFYSNLYDTPSNVKRKRVAMKAIELMVDRSMYESQLRREMTISVFLSSKLRATYRDVNNGLEVGGEK